MNLPLCWGDCGSSDFPGVTPEDLGCDDCDMREEPEREGEYKVPEPIVSASDSGYSKIRSVIPANLLDAIESLKAYSKANVINALDIKDPRKIDELVKHHGLVFGAYAFLFTVEMHDDGLHWHLSMSHSNRYPNWDEIMIFRSAFFDDDMEVIQILPSSDQYVNAHSTCFHLWHKTGKRIITLV